MDPSHVRGEVPEVGARPPVLLAGDLARRDLVEERDRAVAQTRDSLRVQRSLEVLGVHVFVELRDIGDELVAERRALLGGRGSPVLPRRRLAVGVERVLRGNPEVLLDAVEAGPVEALGHGVHLAVVDAGVEVAQRLGDGLDALVVGPHLREGRAGGIVRAGLVGGGELLDLRARAARPGP